MQRLQQKQCVIASPVGDGGKSEVFEDAKLAFDTIISRIGPLAPKSKEYARAMLEGRTPHGVLVSFMKNEAEGIGTLYYMIPASIHSK